MSHPRISFIIAGVYWAAVIVLFFIFDFMGFDMIGTGAIPMATGSKPPYAVRFRAEKSYGVEAPIFKGSGAAVSAPCLAGVFPLCFRLFFAFWVTPENGFAKRHLRCSTCFNAGFSGVPNRLNFSIRFSGSNLCA